MGVRGSRPIRLLLMVGVALLLIVEYVVDPGAPTLPELGTLPAFQLTDEHGGAYGREALVDKVTIVDFVFTSCTSACPLLTAQMARLQDDLRGGALGDGVRLLSISVDPARDTVERLGAYAREHGADPQLWRFVRGDEVPLRHVVVDGMKQVMDRQPDKGEVDGFTILHGTRLMLVDGLARMRGFYDANDATDLERLRHDARLLASTRRGRGAGRGCGRR